MTFRQSILWAYGVTPGTLREVYWQESYDELREMVDLKVQEVSMNQMQVLQHLRLAVNEALGNSIQDAPPVQPSTLADFEQFAISAGGLIM